MHLHSGPTTICTHWRIHLGECQVDGGDGRICRLKSTYNTACYMFQQLRRNGHLTLDELIDLSIVQRIADVVALHGTADVIAQTERDHKVTTDIPFLRQHAVEGIEVNFIQRNITLRYHTVISYEL